MDTIIQSLTRRCNYRTALMGLHIFIAVESFITGPTQLSQDYEEFKYDNNEKEFLFDEYQIYARMVYYNKSIMVNFITGCLSLIFAIMGFFSPGLYEDSSMVVHTSIYLWIVHLTFATLYSISLPYAKNVMFSNRLEFLFVNALKLFLLTAVIILATKLLRKNNSVWPRSNLLKFFTLEFPIIFTRMVLGYIIFIIDPTYYHNRDVDIKQESLKTEGVIYFAALLNAALSTEHFISLFWGILHQKTVAAQTIFNSIVIFTMLIVNYSLGLSSYHFFRISWYIPAAVLSLIHGILSLCLPQFITKIPDVFTRDYEKRSNTTRVTQSGDDSAAYSRMFDDLLNSTDSTEDEDNSVPSSANKLSLRQLSRQSPHFFRYFLYIVVCSVNIIMVTVGLHYRMRKYYAWLPILLLCVNMTVLMRALPDFTVELITRKLLKEPPLVKAFSSVLIESILLMIGSLGSFALTSRVGLIFPSFGIGSLGVIIINLLFLRTYVRAQNQVN